jgi:hypothetical protein
MEFHLGFRRKSFFYLARNFYIYAQFFYFFIFKKLNKNILGFPRNSIYFYFGFQTKGTNIWIIPQIKK